MVLLFVLRFQQVNRSKDIKLRVQEEKRMEALETQTLAEYQDEIARCFQEYGMEL